MASLAFVEKPTFRIIYDLSSQSSRCASVNEDTGFYRAPTCELGHVIRDVLLRVMYSRQKIVVKVRTVLCKLDVNPCQGRPFVISLSIVFGPPCSCTWWTASSLFIFAYSLVGSVVVVFGVYFCLHWSIRTPTPSSMTLMSRRMVVRPRRVYESQVPETASL